MPPNHARPANSPSPPSRSIWLTIGAGFFAAAFFLSGPANEPFADEYAYLTQSYFTDLLLAGKVNDPAWLEFPAYDLPPLPKYLIGASLHAAQMAIPRKAAAFRWYNNINRKFGPQETLSVARVPSGLLGVAGCLAVYAIGVIANDRRAGWIAFFLLMLNPLYGLLARRAMSDIPCETFILFSIASGLVSWKSWMEGKSPSWIYWISICSAGACAGLAVLCKFNGLLALITLAAWGALALVLGRRPLGARIALVVGAIAGVALACLVFVALNPSMTAHPTDGMTEEMARLAEMNTWQRFRFQMDHRRAASSGQQQMFPHNALTGPIERIKVVAVQGFGRFGLLGKRGWSSEEKTSEKRYDWSQDWGALIWGPLVVLGFCATCYRGWRQFRSGEPPASWALAAWGLVTFGVITIYLPMAWDRYLLPIQAVSCLLVASLVSFVWQMQSDARAAKQGAAEA